MTALVEVAAFVPQRRVLIESLARELDLATGGHAGEQGHLRRVAH